MSVKLKVALFRDLLYLREVICYGKISAAAEKNGIKPSNLSAIIKNLEHMSGKKLFLRRTNGLFPTDEALELAQKISGLENSFEQTVSAFLSPNQTQHISLYLPANLQFTELEDFAKKHAFIMRQTDFPEQADVIVSYAPLNDSDKVIVENTIGRRMRQTIWVAAVNKEKALLLAEHLIVTLHGAN